MGARDGSDAFGPTAGLRRLAAACGAVRQAVAAQDAPIRIQVTGRSGVGRTTVAQVLERAGFRDVAETSPIDAPDAPDPVLDGDVVVHVLAVAPRDADIAALRRAPRGSTVAILGKADAQGSSWAAAVEASNACAAETGVRTVPMVGTADDVEAGAEAVTAAVADCIRVALARRTRTLLATLAAQAARGPEREMIEDYLRSDEAVQAAARSAAVVTGQASAESAAERRRAALAADRAQIRASVHDGIGAAVPQW
ncbi:hypothetical protein ERC79_08855 [Rhodococcus sp. ABRD24]|uniref:hypothetical protein n=1 Tax=Rhodococcus sp. ABRD24 TaxID=2507582 RepID=UPI001039C497|nr:hypothetical protein [Rhodococcus sp. ABRD24]QBJ96070.1 hypothetical protein ERC79_08855 [Rhodococcus sp. ABRD24]